ncbi:glycosyltransferase [Flavobacterium sp. JAS]|uniref:glycosyltransferase n=1 Tax=Flavobacterium sp. JAS TaxID=2897329 RepID=UPI001E2AC6E7|nr:hypothetical protein [Flavobacterium sp. JAS]MCD0471101.1 hypothetical protein [Flavobacterium sp. JAS]
MKLELPCWTSHHNMLIYSLLFHCNENDENFDIAFNCKIAVAGAILYVNKYKIFFDYSDNIVFIDNPKQYDFYFKRSFMFTDQYENVHPLNFQVNFSFKTINILPKFHFKDLLNTRNRVEVIRAMDYFNLFTNLSHNAMDIRSFPKDGLDNNGKIIFHTRLWNPDNHSDFEEKSRRENQNEFRIEACRIIKSNFKNVSVGLFPDELSKKIAPDILLNLKSTSKKEYFKSLKHADIGIADDGLKDTPGWKIGEYLLFGKAVITTPVKITLNNFEEHLNYEKVENRNSYLELPEKIEYLLEGKRYLKMGENNLKWSNAHLHPQNYIKRIMNIIENII